MPAAPVSGLHRASFHGFFEQRGDRCGGEDSAILGGIARFHGIPVTVLGHRKEKIWMKIHLPFRHAFPGRLSESAASDGTGGAFSSPGDHLCGYARRLSGKEAEQHGQGEAIARCIASMSGLTVPVLTVVTGEGGSGGALALAVADRC